MESLFERILNPHNRPPKIKCEEEEEEEEERGDHCKRTLNPLHGLPK